MNLSWDWVSTTLWANFENKVALEVMGSGSRVEQSCPGHPGPAKVNSLHWKDCNSLGTCSDAVMFSSGSTLAWSVLGSQRSWPRRKPHPLAGRLETLLARSMCHAILVVAAGVPAYYWSFRFLVCHHGWQHLLAFIEGLIGEWLMPTGLCWLTTLKVVEERYWTEVSCSPCILSSLTGGAWQKISSLWDTHNNSKMAQAIRGWLPERVTRPPKKEHSLISSNLLANYLWGKRGMSITHILLQGNAPSMASVEFPHLHRWQVVTRGHQESSFTDLPEYCDIAHRELGQSGFAPCECGPGTIESLGWG